MSHSIFFDETDLSTMVTVSSFDTPMLPTNIDLVDVPGMDGQRFMGSSLASREIRCMVTLKVASRKARYISATALKELLHVSEPKKLWADWMDPLNVGPGVHSPYYYAVPRSDTDPTQYVNGEAFEIVFVCPDPIAYDGYHLYEYIEVTTTATAVTVEGNMPARPSLYGTSCHGDANGIYRVTNIDTGEYMEASVASNAQSTVLFDCNNHVLKVDGVVQVLPPLCTWFELEPGSTRLQVTAGGGALVFGYVARWL